jgi:hypothetical protein
MSINPKWLGYLGSISYPLEAGKSVDMTNRRS